MSAFGGEAEVFCSTRALLVLTDLRHHRAIFVVMHSGVVPQRCANVRP
jgi:hypothetical protein